MSKKLKRDATPEEVEKTIKWLEAECPNTKEKHEEALAEGYKDEVCLLNKCNAVYLAHHHFTCCPEEKCPMKDGQGSLLDRMQRNLEEQGKEQNGSQTT